MEPTSRMETPSTQSRKIILGWYLFDFANSFLIINGGLYFPQWIVVDNGLPDISFNLTIVLSSVVLLLSAPVLGAVADRRKNGAISYMRAASVIMFCCGIIPGLANGFFHDALARGIIGLLCFFVIMYCYQLSLAFYNSLLHRVSPESRITQTSGVGLSAGWLGGILGILVVLPFVQGYVPLFQPAGRVNAFIPSTVAYGILTFVSFRLLRGLSTDRELARETPPGPSVLRRLWDDLKALRGSTPIGMFLVSYLLFSDAILTLQDNSPIYLERVMGFPDSAKAYLFLLLLFMAAIGGLMTGRVANRMGLKRSLKYTLIGWTAVMVAISVTTRPTVFYVLFAVVGLLFGLVWSLCRALYVYLIPVDKSAQFFGVYSSFERAASILGPIVWSVPVTLMASMQATRYRVAVVLLAILVAISLNYLKKTSSVETVG